MSLRKSVPALSRWALAMLAFSFAAVISLSGAPRPAHQSQDQTTSDSQSIADAARRSREQAKGATKASKVITDDDLDRKNVKPGAQGLTVDAPAKLETQAPTQDAVAAAQISASERTDPATKPASSDDPEIAKLKDTIAIAEQDADFLKRDLALKQDTYFSNPDYVHDTAGKSALDTQQKQINDKQQDIDRLKMRLAALQELQHTPPAAKAPDNPAPPAKP